MTAKNANGALFKNSRKTAAAQPDYTGNMELTRELVEAWLNDMGDAPYKVQIAAWIKQSPTSKENFLSLSVNAPFKGSKGGGAPVRGKSIDDDIPF